MTKQTSYRDYMLLVNEIGRLKNIINVNYNLRIIPQPVIERMIKTRRRLVALKKEKYGDWVISEKLTGHEIYLN